MVRGGLNCITSCGCRLIRGRLGVSRCRGSEEDDFDRFLGSGLVMGLQELGQPQASFKLQGVAAVGIYVFRTDGELPAAPFCWQTGVTVPSLRLITCRSLQIVLSGDHLAGLPRQSMQANRSWCLKAACLWAAVLLSQYTQQCGGGGAIF